MADNEVDFSIVAIDKATAVLQKIQGGVTSFGSKVSGLVGKVKDTIGSMTELNQAWMAGIRAIGYARQAYDEIIGTFLDYASTVDSLTNISGQSTEETSRLIQVTKLYGIETDTLTVAMRTLAKQGKDLSVNVLAEMSDEYLKLGSAQERQLYITKNLGRAGSSWGDILVTGSQNIRDQAASISDYLIMSDEMVKKAEQIEASQLQLAAATDALKLSQAGFWSEIALTGTRLLTIYSKLFEKMGKVNWNPTAWSRLADEAVKETAIEEARLTMSKKLTEAEKELSDVYTTEISLMQTLQSENQGYITKQQELLTKIAEITEKEIEAEKQYGENSTQVADYKAQLSDLSDKYAQNATDHEAATNKIVYNNLLQKLSVDGLSDAEFAMAQQTGVTLGIFDQATADQAIAMNTLTTALVEGKITQDEFTAAVQGGADAVQTLADKVSGLQDRDITITVTTITKSLVAGGTSEEVAKSIAEGVATGSGFNHPYGHAAGGMFEIPSMYSNEGFRMGAGGDTATAGEKLKIIPKGQGDSISKADMKQAVAEAMSPILNQLVTEMGNKIVSAFELRIPRGA